MWELYGHHYHIHDHNVSTDIMMVLVIVDVITIISISFLIITTYTAYFLCMDSQYTMFGMCDSHLYGNAEPAVLLRKQ